MMTITVDRAFSLIARLEGYRNPDRALQRASAKLLRASRETPAGRRLYWLSVAITNHRLALLREGDKATQSPCVWRRDQAIRFAADVID